MSNDNLINSLVEKHSKVKSYNARRAFMEWLIMTILYIAVILLFIGMRHDISACLNSKLFITKLVIMIIVTVWAGYSQVTLNVPALTPAIQMIMPVILAVTFITYLAAFGDIEYIKTLDVSVGDVDIYLLLGLVGLSVPPIIYSYIRIARGTPTSLLTHGAMIFMSSAGAAHVILLLYLPDVNVSSIIIWYYMPLIAMTILGCLLGKRIKNW